MSADKPIQRYDVDGSGWMHADDSGPLVEYDDALAWVAREIRNARAEAFEAGAAAMRASQYVEEAKVMAPLFDMLAKQERQTREVKP